MSARAGSEGLRPLVLISGLGTGGAERVTAAFLRRLAERGVHVPVCTVTARHDGVPARELEAAGVSRHDLGAARLADPGALLRLRRLLRDGRITVVHAHGQDATILGAAATLGTPAAFLATRHVLEEPTGSWRSWVRARLAFHAFRRADAAIAVSRAVAARLEELAGLDGEEIRVVPNGVELERFSSVGAQGRREAVRRSLGIGSERPVVLVPAVLRAGKGHEVLLEAVPPLRTRVPGVRILLAGGGEREAELRARAGGLGVEENVRFLGHRDDVPRLLEACDVVALASHAEALPTALIEAAAAGRPAVATRVGGAPEVVEHRRTGLLVEPGDPEALSEALAQLLADPGRMRRYGREARRRAEERFGIDRQVERTLSLWREVAARADGGVP